MKYYLHFGRTLSIHHDILTFTNAKLTSRTATNQIKDDRRCGILNVLMIAATSKRIQGLWRDTPESSEPGLPDYILSFQGLRVSLTPNYQN
jgi:hypothetical protein